MKFLRAYRKDTRKCVRLNQAPFLNSFYILVQKENAPRNIRGSSNWIRFAESNHSCLPHFRTDYSSYDSCNEANSTNGIFSKNSHRKFLYLNRDEYE